MHDLSVIKKLNGEYPGEEPAEGVKKNQKRSKEFRAAVRDLNSFKIYDVISELLSYEEGELSSEEIIKLFQHLVDTGLAWQLQGSYGRQAKALIDAGYVKLPSR